MGLSTKFSLLNGIQSRSELILKTFHRNCKYFSRMLNKVPVDVDVEKNYLDNVAINTLGGTQSFICLKIIFSPAQVCALCASALNEKLCAKSVLSTFYFLVRYVRYFQFLLLIEITSGNTLSNRFLELHSPRFFATTSLFCFSSESFFQQCIISILQIDYNAYFQNNQSV